MSGTVFSVELISFVAFTFTESVIWWTYRPPPRQRSNRWNNNEGTNPTRYSEEARRGVETLQQASVISLGFAPLKLGVELGLHEQVYTLLM